MYIKNWRKEIFTIPNLLSMFRLILIPVYVKIYLNASDTRDYIIAGIILAASCLTDAIDGKIARKYNMISTLGKILDPMADKFTQLALTICLSLKYPVLNPVLALFLVKEVSQLVGAIILLSKGNPFPSSIFAGKLCTTVLFVSLITLVLFPDIPSAFVNGIALLDSGFLIYAFFSYCNTFLKSPKRLDA